MGMSAREAQAVETEVECVARRMSADPEYRKKIKQRLAGRKNDALLSREEALRRLLRKRGS